MGTKGKGGRPRVKNKRDHQITVRLTGSEHRKLQQATSGRSIAALVRDRLLGLSKETGPQVPLVNRQAWIDLSRTASNLNQMCYRLNTGGRPEVDRILPLLSLLQRNLEQVRAGLIGGGHGHR
ncbi:plasmid mobilization protein [Neptunicoccus sediminis]|uniref:plasmid mobilization protein n=1 Tax=Neptunicoccus sediminis TaxID=1892596 RepID=UPI0012FF76CD|nr:hypothetical protein [Neptunicoccus sediminis]